MSLSEDRLVRQWSGGHMSSRVYDFTIKRERLFRLLSRIVWGGEVRAFYADIAALQDVAPGSSVLDVPSGGGVAFRGLSTDAEIRYVAADASPFMLRLARAEAARRGLEKIEYVHTGVEAMPFDDATFDLCVSYNGLHCFSDPPAAVAEMARVVRPGGELRGTVVVTDGGALSAAAIAFFRRTDQFGQTGSADDVRRWLSDGGFADVRLDRRGAYLLFSARRADEE
ncbi:class I SAM-dependent methyltransferase [Actinomadura alba]|uniref:Methyltransferase domain-containing protein n=1 Tax=Actinomadura alba TaxID=406431 RepID=A0ABR7LZS3_9ACTN|nr:methyltransferase domain-containing protein [Actinomadura alba]MBC6470261.1 methyltransferase domain-containing protein [Actinomadura alba]